jgi:hypothetical protein
LTKLNDRRSGIERRKSSGLNLRSLIYGGNRIQIRRQDDRERIFFVDQYSPKLFIAIVVVLFLCVIDALLTLFLIGHGAYETNPILACLLDVGPYTFFIPKYVVTIVAISGLLILKNTGIRHFNISTRQLLFFIAGLYSIVVAWELYMVSEVVI